MKRISPGTVTVGVLAVGFGLVAAYVVRHYSDASPVQTPTRQTAAVVTASVNLPKYGRIRDEDLQTVQMPIEEVPEGAVQSASRALFRLVKTTVMAGQPILEADLYAVGEVPLLADQLPPGYRAVTLQVDANSALNGMIQPESYVDVALTVRGQQPEIGGLSTLTLMRGVEVLATSQTRFPRSEDQPANLRNITVAVTPQQANRLILAQRYGTLSVTLCSSLEGDMVAQAEMSNDLVNPNDLLGLVPQPPPPEPPAPVYKRAQIWRGSQMQEVVFAGTQPDGPLGAAAIADAIAPTPAMPVGSGSATPGGSGCKECEKKQGHPAPSAAGQIPPSASAQDGPTPAPPQPTPSLAAGSPFQQGQRGQVIYVRAEAEGAGVASN
jgi:pilus assembly protein CpaB